MTNASLPQKTRFNWLRYATIPGILLLFILHKTNIIISHLIPPQKTPPITPFPLAISHSPNFKTSSTDDHIMLQVKTKDIGETLTTLSAHAYPLKISDILIEKKAPHAHITIKWSKLKTLLLFFSTSFLVVLATPTFSETPPIFRYPSNSSAPLSSATQPSPHPPKKIRVYPLTHANPEELATHLSTFFTDATITPYNTPRQLNIYSTFKTYRSIRKMIRTLDIPRQQIRLNVLLYELTKTQLSELKLPFSKTAADLFFTIENTPPTLESIAPLSAQLSLLEQTGKATLIANPTLSTIDNANATIEIGDKIPFSTTVVNGQTISTKIDQFDTGLRLDIHARITSKNNVTIALAAEITKIKLWHTLGAATYPILSTRKAKTTLFIPNKKTALIGGLINEDTKNVTVGIPFLKDLPVLGHLFQETKTETEKTDLIFLITPTIIANATIK